MTAAYRWMLCGLLVGCTGAPTDVPVDGLPDLGKASADPVVTAASPDAANPDTTLDVHVLGSGFDRGSKVAFARDGVVDPKLQVNGTAYRTSGELIASVTVAADAATVPYDVVVTTSKGKKGIGTELFVVTVPMEPLPSPSAPSSGSSNVWDVGGTGIIVGTFGTKCGPGFAPALWDRGGSFVALPALAGTCGGVARGVNSGGTAVGDAYIGSSPSAAVRWTAGPGGYALDVIPRLPDGSDPGPWAINDAGVVSSGNAAALWTESSGWTLATKPAGAQSCVLTVLNNAGQFASHCNVGGQTLGVFWASLLSAPTLLPLPTGAVGAYPRGIDGSGTIVGFVTGGGYRAVRWTLAGSTWSAEFLPDLGYGSAASGTDEAGYVVGSVYKKNGFGHPAYWDPDGTLHLLDDQRGAGEALGISEPDGGLVIGGRVGSAVRWLP